MTIFDKQLGVCISVFCTGLLAVGALTWTAPVALGDGPGPSELVIIDHEGDIQLLEFGDESSTQPIILLNDEVLTPGDIDCEIATLHPQCQALESVLADGGANPETPPGIVAVQTKEGVEFSTSTPWDYPPPLVFVDGVLVNRN